jgi:hypothetical protein
MDFFVCRFCIQFRESSGCIQFRLFLEIGYLVQCDSMLSSGRFLPACPNRRLAIKNAVVVHPRSHFYATPSRPPPSRTPKLPTAEPSARQFLAHAEPSQARHQERRSCPPATPPLRNPEPPPSHQERLTCPPTNPYLRNAEPPRPPSRAP